MRALWAFRLIFYPAAALIAVLALVTRVDAEPERETWHGRTSQGRPVSLALVGERDRQRLTAAGGSYLCDSGTVTFSAQR